MSDITKATAPTSEVQIQGKTWILSPLTMRSLGQLVQWARDQIVASAKGAIRNESDLTINEKAMFVDRAYREARTITFEQLGGMNQDPEFIVRLIWLSMRIAQPKLTLDDIDQMFPLSDMEFMTEIGEKIQVLSELKDEVVAPVAGTKSHTGPAEPGKD